MDVWSEKSHTENQSWTIYHSAYLTCLIFIFTTKRTGFSRFRVFVFGFHLRFCVMCVSVRVRVRENRAELMKRREPPPPKSLCGFICIDYNSLFFPKSTVAKKHHALKTNKSIDLNSSFSIFRQIVIMFGYKIRCMKYFLGVKQCSDFLPHLCLKIIFFWLYTV